MDQPKRAADTPYGVLVKPGKDLLLVRLRIERQPAVLRRLAQGHRIYAGAL